eukprot:CAMPEP_0116871982 /NCGR_PEP_ID=MMETSP0463-20121206/2584_1 /TAXON_ID=181622 /ORGANISM="Strombidinopsis sp, Strain SopsisLIS2011" /LENGTH=65 /DNA_ID=CAMNT_0004511451 /DNA_START=1239 /DNA_END=1436 /DNA_ORIENTATION=-
MRSLQHLFTNDTTNADNHDEDQSMDVDVDNSNKQNQKAKDDKGFEIMKCISITVDVDDSFAVLAR